MKKILSFWLALILAAGLFSLTACGKGEKKITVVIREQGSGTREAFDKVVTDGERFLEETDDEGKKVYHSVKDAIQQTKTGTVLSSVMSDKNAIGYVSLGSLNSDVNTVKVNGVLPGEETVLDGTYKIQRPYVIMTSATVNPTVRNADFLLYLKSSAAKAHAEAAGCIFLTDASKRANEGASPIEVVAYEKQASLPTGDKIVIRGSTSTEKFITSAAKGYAELYGVNASDIFDIQLEGSSVGRKAVKEDKKGNVIGLSSAAVMESGINSFNVCVDAIAVIVNRENTAVTDLTLKELFDIFSGKITKFRELEER